MIKILRIFVTGMTRLPLTKLAPFLYGFKKRVFRSASIKSMKMVSMLASLSSNSANTW